MPTFNNMEQALEFCAKLIAEGARQNSSWSTGGSRGGSIPSAISTTSVRKLPNGGLSVRVIVDLKKAPQAGAFEFGSGLHDPSNPSTYRIDPNKAPYLVFFWTPQSIPWRSPKFHSIIKSGAGTSGKYFFNYVDHPGVKARPYLRPSRDANIPVIRQILGESFRTVLISRIRTEIIDHP